jgi:hypothetical protein
MHFCRCQRDKPIGHDKSKKSGGSPDFSSKRVQAVVAAVS